MATRPGRQDDPHRPRYRRQERAPRGHRAGPRERRHTPLPFVTDHAVERFREHHPEADESDVLVAHHEGQPLPTQLALALMARKPSATQPGDSYVATSDCRGLLIVERSNLIRTYIRLCPRAVRVLAGGGRPPRAEGVSAKEFTVTRLRDIYGAPLARVRLMGGRVTYDLIANALGAGLDLPALNVGFALPGLEGGWRFRSSRQGARHELRLEQVVGLPTD